MYCAGLGWAVLCYTVLYCTVLCSTVLCFALLCCDLVRFGPVQGLKGEYYLDTFFTNLAVERIDSMINFTWGTGNVIPMALNYISIR